MAVKRCRLLLFFCGDLLSRGSCLWLRPRSCSRRRCVCLRYKVTQVELFALLCRLADELLFRQISWIKKLPFFCELSIEDYTCLLSSTWQELILLSCFTIYSSQIFGELADVTAKYTPSDDELQR